MPFVHGNVGVGVVGVPPHSLTPLRPTSSFFFKYTSPSLPKTSHGGGGGCCIQQQTKQINFYFLFLFQIKSKRGGWRQSSDTLLRSTKNGPKRRGEQSVCVGIRRPSFPQRAAPFKYELHSIHVIDRQRERGENERVTQCFPASIHKFRDRLHAVRNE